MRPHPHVTVRHGWADLPVATRAAIETRTGLVTAVVDVPHGITCRFAAVLTTSRGRVFAKGVPAGEVDGVAQQHAEIAVNPLVTAVGPRLLWYVDVGGWDLLGFDHVAGRHANLSPGSVDLSAMTDTLDVAARITPLASAATYMDRWAKWLDTAESALLAGGRLAHTDLNPYNILINHGRARIVDWAMSAAAPAWLDAADVAIRLMEDGHTAPDALAWAEGCDAWAAATSAAVRAWASAACRRMTAAVGAGAAEAVARYEAFVRACRLG